MNEPKKRGGARRQGKTQTNMTFSIDNDLVEPLREKANTNRFVNETLREKIKSEEK
jgi:uncharacterized protein (DUF4415 family)